MDWQSLNVLQWIRYLIDRWLIVPAAARLPLGVAVRCADAAALLDVAIPSRMSRTARAEIWAATGLTGWSGLGLAWARLAATRREIVHLTRMGAGRERLDAWRVIEMNGERVHELTATGASFVLATGHFSSAAIDVAQQTLPSPAAFVAGEVGSSSTSPGELRRQLSDRCRDAGRNGLLGTCYSADELWIRVPDLWGPDANWDDASARVAAAHQMLRVLQRAGGIVLVRIDAYWAGAPGMERAFAGVESRRFALGAARVARLAQCPVVPFVAILSREPRTVIVEWGDPIPPPPRRDEAADSVTLDRALSHIEVAIGRYPTHFLAQVGWERRWRAHTQTWESVPPGGSVA